MSNKLFITISSWAVLLWIISGVFSLTGTGLILYILYKIATRM